LGGESGGAAESADPSGGAAKSADPGGGDASVGANNAGGGGVCAHDRLELALRRVERLSLRLAASAPEDPLPRAVSRAAAAAEAIARGSLAGLAAPDVADLAYLPPDSLETLATAEDQAAFISEYLATFHSPSDPARAAVAAAAQAHRHRAEALVTMAGTPDPRPVAYQLGAPPTDQASADARRAAVELALASHYAALPLTAGGGAEPTIRWQLVQAHACGAELPALPFAASN
jgi:hypothetical protein